jgi:hypothetical protein
MLTVVRELIQIAKINREANVVSHALAKLGRVKHRPAVWHRNFPTEIERAITDDCNSTLN